MPEDDTLSHPPAPQYIPAPHLIESSPLTAEDLTYYFKDFYGSLGNVSHSPSLVFERLVANLIGSKATLLSRKPTKDLGHDSCVAALEKCRDENKALSLGADKLKAELATAKIELEMTKKELAAAREQPPKTEIVETGPDIGDFYNAESTSKEIVFPRPYSAPPGVAVGMRWIDAAMKNNALRATSYATDIRNDGFRIHYGENEPDNTARSTVRSSWLVVPPGDPNFQCGTISVEETPFMHQGAPINRQITFARPYRKPPQVVVYLASFEMLSDGHGYTHIKAEGITTTGFTLVIVTTSAARLKECTASWVSCPEGMPNVCMGTTTLRGGDINKYTKFDSGDFTTPPRVLVAISLIYMVLGSVIKIKVVPHGVDVNGFSLDLQSQGDSMLYNVYVAFIALG